MKNNIQSIKDKLRNYSKQHHKIHQFTLTRFFQERLLFRLSKSDYKNKFLLKGGALIYSIHKEESRPTLDIDLLAKNMKADDEEIKSAFVNICSLEFQDGVIFNSEHITVSEIIKEGNYSGIRIKVPASLGNINQIMQIDIGFGDIVTPGPVEMEYPVIINMESPKILAYSVESLVSEKFEAMIALAEYNSRMKDFYDLYIILDRKEYNTANLKKAIINTFKKRNTQTIKDHSLFRDSFFIDKNRVIQWQAFLKKSNLDTDIAFSSVMNTIKKVMEPMYNDLIERG